MFRHSVTAAFCLAATSVAYAGFSESILASADGDVAWNGLAYSVDTTSSTLTMVRSGGNNVRNGIMEFDLGFLPTGAILTGATLRVTTSGLISNTSATAPLLVYALAGDGVITSDDHQNLTPGALMASLALPTGSGTPSGTVLEIELDDLTALQSIYDSGATHLALRLQTQNFATIRVHSLETASSTAIRPTLDILYIPSPSGLAGAAILGLLAARRRR